MPRTVVEIVFQDGELTIEAGDHILNGNRFKEHKARREHRWEKRNPKKALPDHDPIMMSEDEDFDFKCTDLNVEFGIGVKKASEVDEFPNTPEDPFIWTAGQTAAAGGTISAKVRKTLAAAPGPKYQAFYKFHGWVKVGSVFIPFDPDGYCGG